jgi:hypothetical protein
LLIILLLVPSSEAAAANACWARRAACRAEERVATVALASSLFSSLMTMTADSFAALRVQQLRVQQPDALDCH